MRVGSIFRIPRRIICHSIPATASAIPLPTDNRTPSHKRLCGAVFFCFLIPFDSFPHILPVSRPRLPVGSAYTVYSIRRNQHGKTTFPAP